MRKYLIATLISTCALSLAACSGGDDKNAPADATDSSAPSALNTTTDATAAAPQQLADSGSASVPSSDQPAATAPADTTAAAPSTDATAPAAPADSSAAPVDANAAPAAPAPADTTAPATTDATAPASN